MEGLRVCKPNKLPGDMNDGLYSTLSDKGF
jgi:hypothetical protein